MLKLFKDERGATGVEYGMIASLIGVGIMVSLTSFSDTGGNVFNVLSATMGGATENDLTDGAGFFDTDVLDDEPGDHFATGVSEHNGWSVSGDVDQVAVFLSGYVAETSNGSGWYDLVGGPGQSVEMSYEANLVAGHEYTFRGEYNESFEGNPATAEVFVNGVSIGTIDPQSGPEFSVHDLKFTVPTAGPAEIKIVGHAGNETSVRGVGAANLEIF